MGRPREFDIDQALDRAMGVFWQKGYEGASLQDLLGAMQIARGSLYKAFEDKHSIYLATLDRYDRTEVEAGIAFLCDPEAGDGLTKIRSMLESVKSDKARRGCFLCNAAIDRASLGAQHPDVPSEPGNDPHVVADRLRSQVDDRVVEPERRDPQTDDQEGGQHRRDPTHPVLPETPRRAL